MNKIVKIITVCLFLTMILFITGCESEYIEEQEYTNEFENVEYEKGFMKETPHIKGYTYSYYLIDVDNNKVLKIENYTVDDKKTKEYGTFSGDFEDKYKIEFDEKTEYWIFKQNDKFYGNVYFMDDNWEENWGQYQDYYEYDVKDPDYIIRRIYETKSNG